MIVLRQDQGIGYVEDITRKSTIEGLNNVDRILDLTEKGPYISRSTGRFRDRVKSYTEPLRVVMENGNTETGEES